MRRKWGVDIKSTIRSLTKFGDTYGTRIVAPKSVVLLSTLCGSEALPNRRPESGFNDIDSRLRFQRGHAGRQAARVGELMLQPSRSDGRPNLPPGVRIAHTHIDRRPRSQIDLKCT